MFRQTVKVRKHQFRTSWLHTHFPPGRNLNLVSVFVYGFSHLPANARPLGPTLLTAMLPQNRYLALLKVFPRLWGTHFSPQPMSAAPCIWNQIPSATYGIVLVYTHAPNSARIQTTTFTNPSCSVMLCITI